MLAIPYHAACRRAWALGRALAVSTILLLFLVRVTRTKHTRVCLFTAAFVTRAVKRGTDCFYCVSVLGRCDELMTHQRCVDQAAGMAGFGQHWQHCIKMHENQ